MRRDHEVQRLVQEQLDCDPAIDSSRIGVAVNDGIVTLTGHVPSIGEKRAAEVSAGAVRGVRAVVDDIAVELPGGCETDDETIAARACARLDSNKMVPLERIRLSVDNGVVTLRGEVSYQYQREAAEEDLHKLDCVREIHNQLVIRPPVEVERVREKVHNALARLSPLDADAISVETDGGRVTLSGTVNSWREKGLVENAAWSVPGVIEVVARITVA